MKPLIGISCGYKSAGDFSPRAHYAVSQAYASLIEHHGGQPIMLPFMADYKDILNRLDGVLLTDGRFPFPPSWYADGNARATEWPPEVTRGLYEEALTHAALVQDLPVLGICCGMQMLAAAQGAKFKRLSPVGENSAHLVPGGAAVHEVQIKPESRLAEILGVTNLMVNSLHNEAIATLPTSVSATAHAPDDVIEAIELTGQRFALGVQWHPEIPALADTHDPQNKLFAALVKAAADA
jgi:putative glutamine amidotransferase